MDENDNILEFVGRKIRSLRKSYGLSQDEFAFRCNLDRTYISDIELGKRNISLINIRIISDVLQIHISQLFSGFRKSPYPCQYPYKTNKDFFIRCGFEVNAEDVEYAAIFVSNRLGDLPFTLYQHIDLKTVSSIVGAFFSLSLAERVGAIVNPIEKGHPDIIPIRGKNATEGELRNFPEGLEIKCTIGNVAKGCNSGSGQQRVGSLTGITWQAHHREVNKLMGLVIDFAGKGTADEYFPVITGIFYSDDLEMEDWGEISGTRGRNTKVTGMRSAGKEKMGKGWILLMDHPDYISKYQKLLSFILT